MNKKGFTVMEILTVLAVISVVLVSTVVSLDKVLKTSQATNMINLESDIISAAEVYISSDEYLSKAVYNGTEINIYLKDLIEEGVLETNYNDRVTNEKITDKSYVKVKLVDGAVTYTPIYIEE